MPGKNMFDTIRLKGARVSSSAFSVYYKDMGVALKPRIVVSQKIDKRATVRNRLRRQIREILKPLSPSLGLIVITKKSVLERDFSAMRRELLGLFK